MTIEGAIAELQNLIKADDVPFYYNGAIQKVIETIIDESKPKVGRWIEKSGMWCDDPTFECSICGEEIELTEGTPKSHGMNYCPNCGAKMERRVDCTVFTVNPPKGIETPLKGDVTVFHKKTQK